MTAWWETAFGAHYGTVYAHRSDEAAQAEVAGLLPGLRAAGGLVCDACCGNGRHLAAMRGAGLRAVGFDFSGNLVTEAIARPATRGRVLRADVRAPALRPGSFDAVTLLFTAFGYFDDATNAIALAAVVALVRPGGVLVIDLPHAKRLRDRLVPESRRERDGTAVHERRRLEGALVVKDVEIRRAGSTIATWQERVRLYEDAEVADLARRCGAAVTEIWPSLRGVDIDEDRRVYWLRRG